VLPDADLDSLGLILDPETAKALSQCEFTLLDSPADVIPLVLTFLGKDGNSGAPEDLQAVAAQNIPVNIKKGQFLAPWDMVNVVNKAKATGNDQIMVCERGASFGYNNLVSDMRSLAVMRETGCPVVFDATHSVQLPGGQGTSSGGQREFVPVLARAAVAVGIAGLFMETHPNPAEAKSDGANSWPMYEMEGLLETLLSLDNVVKKSGFAL
jgi:2-dehydro-3-deoxyphosphooctonate aldolase (KDO 8-P synthase)